MGSNKAGSSSKKGEKNTKEETKKKEVKAVAVPLSGSEAIIAAVRNLERSLKPENNIGRNVSDTRLIARWLSTMKVTRSRTNASLADVAKAASVLLQGSSSTAVTDAISACSSKYASSSMDIEESSSAAYIVNATTATQSPAPCAASVIPPVEAWLLSLALYALISDDTKADATKREAALSFSGLAIKIVRDTQNATQSTYTQPLIARLHRYRALAAERVGKAAVVALRPELVDFHRVACINRDYSSQATILNLLLRDLLSNNLVEAAQKLVANTVMPDSASNNQLCRYLFYSGRILALQLEYTDSFAKLSQCLRKVPTNTAIEFRIEVQRLVIIVQLLMGEIPARSIFFEKGMKKSLEKYMELTQAVRRGDLNIFNSTVAKYGASFKADGTFTLINRLSHNVVKAGLRKLNVSYSRISLSEIAKRLALESAESAEFVCSKAIRDGVIDAVIDHEGAFLKSNEMVDVYSTSEPQEAFHRRIAFCLNTHNDAAKGMRYPEDVWKKEQEKLKKKKGDEDMTEEEVAKEIENEFDEEE